MVTFQVVETFLGAPLHFLSAITDMELVQNGADTRLYTVTRAGGGLLALDLGTALTLLDQKSLVAGSTLPAPGRLEVLSLAGQDAVVVMGGNGARLGGYALAAGGQFADAAQIIGSPSGTITAQATVQLGGAQYLYLSRVGDTAISAYRLQADGRAEFVFQQIDDKEQPAGDIAALTSVRIGGATYLLALSATESGLHSFRVQSGGGLVETSTLGADAGLGLAAPSALLTVVVADKTYVLAAAAGSSSISVVAIDTQGRLSLSDHVVDTLGTRFQGVQAMASVTLGGRVFVFAGGGDDGVNLFTLLPDGRLLLLAAQLKMAGLPLDNITALAATVVDGQIELFAAGEGAGIMRLRIDPGALAVMMQGSAGADTLTGGAAGDLISGGGGNDLLQGGGGDDILMDGAGADILFGGAGADIFILSGDGEADVIRDFQVGIDRIDLTDWGRIFSTDALNIKARSNGSIVITYGQETLTIFSGNGQPIPATAFRSSDLFGLWHVLAPPPIAGVRVEGSNQQDNLVGDGGGDTLVGSDGADVLNGMEGFDFVDYSSATEGLRVDLQFPDGNTGIAVGDNYISIEGVIGGAGNDVLGGTSAANDLRGGGGHDTLIGRGGADTLYGGAGDDVLQGGSGADRLYGGVGRDRASYVDAVGAVLVDLLNAANNTGDAAGDRFNSIEDLDGGAYGDTLAGDAAANVLIGQDGSDILLGRDGNDSLYGGFGNDTLMGGGGDDLINGGRWNDTVVYTGSAALRLDLRVTTAQDTGHGFDTVLEVENVRSADGADHLTGTNGNNLLDAGAGNDTLFGEGGNDVLRGGAGTDRLYGGDGDDRIEAGDGSDFLYGGNGNDRLLGEAGNDRLWGEAGNDQLLGGDGNDVMSGGAGADTLWGGAGNDVLSGGDGSDTAVFTGAVSVRVNLGITRPQATGHGTDLLRGIENIIAGSAADFLIGNGFANRLEGGAGRDRLFGGGGNDVLLGGAGNDTLRGDAGRDQLEGGAGHDLMTGGLGADTFVFTAGRDRITDFNRAEGDQLMLDDAGLTMIRGMSAAQLVGSFATDTGNDVVFDFGGGHRLTLEGVSDLSGLANALIII
ncbi:MAG: calcium-binding protein [Paracoccaceae bacterium]|nr:calcium-binding protein [Paracoccaceae bacterium]